LAPLASLSLAGQEHGRTIALADIAGGSFKAKNPNAIHLYRECECNEFQWAHA
jgi:hypothetical protein